jgi:hypothetical protein
MPVDDFIFRELVFALVCICSGCPELLRVATRTRQTDKTMTAPFAMLKSSGVSSNVPEFASAIFHGFHLEDRNPRSAPQHDSYWLEDVLVYLTRDLTSVKSIQEAIYEVFNRGRRDNHKSFNAIVTSITYVVLVYVTEQGVQHTKRLHLLKEIYERDRSMDSQPEGLHRSEREFWGRDTNEEDLDTHSSGSDGETAADAPMTGWGETGSIDVLLAIAQVFEATAQVA